MDSSHKKITETKVLVDLLRNRLDLLVICLSHSWGGLEQVAATDALEIGALGLKTRVLCIEGSPIHQFLSKRTEVKIVPIQYRPRNYFDLKMRQELKYRISEGTNLVHTHQTSLLGSISPWMWQHRSVALFATRHMLSNHYKNNFFHRMIYARVDSLLVMSETLRQNVLETHPVREPRVKVVNLGLDFLRFDPEKVDAKAQREKWGAGPDTIVIGLVGRIDPAKGQGTFIKAAAGLMKNGLLEEKLKFIIVGEETRGSNEAKTHVQELKRMVTQFRLEDRVVFAGFQENVPEVMQAFDIFVMPSRQETFGLVAIEAMAMECPIVISSGGSAEEIIGGKKRGPFGLVMRPDDAYDLQKQLRYLLDHACERNEMGKRARDHVVKNYDRNVRLRRTLELYERALRRRGIA